jgi:hypothetical protein
MTKNEAAATYVFVADGIVCIIMKRDGFSAQSFAGNP